MRSDLELMELQASTLFLYDTRGRMLDLNEPEPDGSAPRLFLGRTGAGNIWRFRADLPDSLIAELDALLQTEPVIDDVSRPARTLPGLVAALQTHASVRDISMGPAWRFPDQLACAEGTVPVSRSNVGMMRRHYPWTADHLEALQPCWAVMVDGEAVSICFSSRTSGGAAEAGLDTVAAFRGRGYAPAVVTGWAKAVRASNRVPLYSTAWDNLASRAVAGKLGLLLYGADLSIT